MVLVSFSDELIFVDDDDDDLFDKCANEDFVNFGFKSVVIVGEDLSPFVTPK